MKRITLLLFSFTLALVALTFVEPAQAQETKPERTDANERDTHLPRAWREWQPYQPPDTTEQAPAEVMPEVVRQAGARPAARWISVDPLADEFPAWSPYNYVLGNPISYTDPMGMAPIVTIDGPDADRATEELNKSTSLTITRDPTTGVLSASGTAATAADQALLDAIQSTDVLVQLHTTTSNTYTSIDGTLQLLRVGTFDGSTKVPGFQIFGVDIPNVFTSQFVNMNHASVEQSVGGAAMGLTVLHEINESYLGAIQDQRMGVRPYSSASFQSAHQAASAIDPPSPRASFLPPVHQGNNLIFNMQGPTGMVAPFMQIPVSLVPRLGK